MRDYKVYLEDISQATIKIEKYVKGLTHRQFQRNDLVLDAVIRNLEIIGEASKNIPPNVKKQLSDIEWKKLVGLRNILIHEYFGVDIEILWDIVTNKIPGLRKEISKSLKRRK